MITPDTILKPYSHCIRPYYVEDLVCDAATKSTCVKSQRGVALVSPDAKEYLAASNSPPKAFQCDGSEWCRAHCNKVAVHAEERAIIQAQRDLTGWEMFHIRLEDGTYESSGSPSCWQCSRMIVEAGIAGMWLLHEGGWKRYTAEEFHRLTLEYCMPR